MAHNTTSEATNFERTRKAAEAVLARKLSAQTIGEAEHAQFLNADVKIDIGLDDVGMLESKLHNETIRLTIESSQVEAHANHIRQAIEKTLQGIEPIDEFVRARSPEEEIHYVKSKLAELKNAGADIPDSTFKWAGFDDRNEAPYEVDDYLVNVSTNAHGVDVQLNMPSHMPDGLSTDSVTENIKARLDDIKAMLVKRIEHFSPKGDHSNLEEAVNNLEFTIRDSSEHMNGADVRSGNIYIEIRSPEQSEAHAAHDDNLLPQSDPELEKTNPLQNLEPMQTIKAISRALQQAGDKAEDIMPVIAGTQDMQKKLSRALTTFEEKHPQYAHQVADVANSSVFMKTNWFAQNNDKKFTKHPVVYKKEATEDARGKLTVEMVVPEGQAANILQKLAAMDTQHSQAEQFATIDSVQLIGAASPNPQLHAQLQQLVAPYIGQTYGAEEKADRIKPFAKQLIALVKQAQGEALHAETVNHDRGELSESPQVSKARSNANPQPASTSEENTLKVMRNTPSPIPSPVVRKPEWIASLVERTADKGAAFSLGA